MADTRATLRDAGLQLWADAGWAAVTVPAVCAATGLTGDDFHAEYDSAEDLLGDIFDEGTEERGAIVLTAMESADGGSRIALIRATLEALTRYFEQDPRQVVVLMEAWGSPVLRARRRATNRGFGALVGAERAKLGTPPDAGLLQAATQFCIAGFHELVMSWQDPESPLDREGVVEHGTVLFEAALGVH